ncbi:GMP synthase [Candidatus Izimaplasma bacterium HR1]|jgi:GMP synthase (glutamine-hydrolysing)|uniref:glutamine-hydrolyzing GMP synthase n=1 Tax=Candidatus Izimoplasma sp. HR1 TaxID=1541959 RepID=UPI0004F6981E|nr:GMP synthase [Candidatus Izimaplasma bacterium HR1]
MEKIIVLDFGSQYNQLIARRVRELGVFSEIVPFNIELEKLSTKDIKGIILSGGPNSVYDEFAPHITKDIYKLGIPILGICYGMQITQYLFEGKISPAEKREYGKSTLTIKKDSPLTKNLPESSTVWMSHGDHVDELSKEFELLGTTPSCVAIAKHKELDLYNLQFHPEVTHTEFGKQIIENFVVDICKAKPSWNLEDYIDNTIKGIKDRVGDNQVILALSGGVDSSVAAMLIHKAIGDQLTCVFVDTGLLRKDEGDKVMELYANNFHINVNRANAGVEFLTSLKGVKDPEQKRKIIGNEFIKVFESFKEKHKDAKFLAQGTIYPDVIESVSINGPSETIKSHHNVGGLPDELDFELLEPLRELFKDEVRKVGLKLGIPKHMIMRHPFPGPGLGIRILGDVSVEKVKILQEADDIFIEELYNENLYDLVSQAFVVLLPVKTVGVMGDKRTYEYVAAVRSADTIDFMTATFSRLSFDFLDKVASRIINEVKGINRVVYDITSKPPGTIEWE